MGIKFYTILVFCMLVAAEALWMRRSGRRYPLNTTVSNMTCGVLNLSTRLFDGVAEKQ